MDERKVRVSVQGFDITVGISDDATLINLFEEINRKMETNNNPSDFYFLTPDRYSVDNTHVFSAIQLQSNPHVYLVDKDAYFTEQVFLTTVYPSLKLEALRMGPQSAIFLSKLHDMHEAAKESTDDNSIAILLSLLPLDQFGEEKSPSHVKYILNWFFTDFFILVGDPKCRHCGSSTVYSGNQPPTRSELNDGVHHVERFRCISCDAINRIKRSRSLKYLINTRSGRSDEAALLFAAILNVFEYKTRIVSNIEEDHAWVEYYSDTRGAYIHVDPSENVYDRPLVYERDWEQIITWVVAVGVNECVDVTGRYTRMADLIEASRTEYTEINAKYSQFVTLRHKMWISGISEKLRKEIEERMASDCATFSVDYPDQESGYIHRPRSFLYHNKQQTVV